MKIERDPAGNLLSPDHAARVRHRRISSAAYVLSIELIDNWNGEDDELIEIIERAKEIATKERDFRKQYPQPPLQ